ncbi:glucose-6-phosphate dehydrogenase [Methylococcus mesophilus]|uniref:glucose-6-phosphate dehydrogenase n=1 Tax=Methylococcus mesophilus TaxID=2993564 RepID=UPI00224BA0A3|nr:glucose-6-phosphate dehydrogenase [Methylococcus mesophilus]UZR27577.1 glucose-6-phosphate dehydrogenase [Methylococcus mesophilus]
MSAVSQLPFPESFNMVFFGGAGDLVTRKLLPAMYQCHKNGLLVEAGHILCVDRQDLSEETFLELADEKARHFIPAADWDETVWAEFRPRLTYLRIDATQPEQYAPLKERLKKAPAAVTVFYLSTAPFLFATICAHLTRQGLNGPNSRVVLEKPLGHDLASANAITADVDRYFHENQVYRIDHYLGKESVQNLMALRFGNALFEPLWRRMWIRDVQITIAEDVGIGTRAGFYDKAGALRDMVQNHLLQLLCFVAMEPPASLDSNAIRNEKLKVLESLVPFTDEGVHEKTVRGQYRAGISGGKAVPGYLEEEGIPPGSHTETFVAIKAEIANWRWAGVPFYLFTGKRLAERLAEIVIHFHDVPHPIFPLPKSGACAPAKLVIRLQPDEFIRLYLYAKQPGDSMELQPVSLDLNFAEQFKVRRTEGGYERLLLDAIRGNQALFVRQDEQEQAWRWVEPILNTWANDPKGPLPYAAGTWGPAASLDLLERDGICWHEGN